MIEVLGLLITVTGAFIGLTASFMLNDAKSKVDKSQHLIAVLLYQQQKQNTYIDMLNSFDTTSSDSASIQHAKYFETSNPYPFYSNINDIAVYDMTDATRDLLASMDQNARNTFKGLDENRVHHFNKQFLIQIRHWIGVSGQQVENEIFYQQGKLDTYDFLNKRDSMVYDNKNFIENHVLKE